MASDFKEEKTKRRLDLLRKKEEERNVGQIASRLNLPYADLSTFPVEIDAIKIVPEEKARPAGLVVFQVSGKHLRVAVHNPEVTATQALLKELQDARFTFEIFLVSESSLKHAWSYYKKVPKEYDESASVIQVSQEKLEPLKKQFTTLAEITAKVEETFRGRTTESLEIILAGALAVDASDVHIEPQPAKARLRFRLDGVLHDVTFFPENLYRLLLSRIKLVSELKLNIHDKAQDGRFTIHVEGEDIEVRTSTLPGPEGENIVLRILNPKSIGIEFSGLGMHPTLVKTMETELKKPNGMILTTGPTGSGKTTALYAFLRKIHTPEIKVITIEDPIEYHLSGIEQTQVDAEKGYDFASGLRAIVRQDPDVILVGEIRDVETAETAINAALTGHLVFSTLHTNNAAGAIPRLINLGVKPSSIAPAVNATLAQRLVRKLCAVCRQKAEIKDPDKKKFEEELSKIPKSIPVPSDWTVFESAKKGCKECNGTGYKGRIGVFEIILVNEEVEKLLQQDVSEYELQKEAVRQGQMTMRQDGLLKILEGITDFAELERVVGTEN